MLSQCSHDIYKSRNDNDFIKLQTPFLFVKNKDGGFKRKTKRTGL